MTISAKEKLRVANWAQKNIFVLLLLTIFFSPFVGYAYTGKYINLIVTFSIMAFIANFYASAGMGDSGGFWAFTYPGFWLVIVGWYIISLIDNFWTIKASQNKLINDSLGVGEITKNKLDNNRNNSEYKNNQNIQIRLLNFMKEKREVTLADCVLETEMSSQKIKNALEQMVKYELIAVSNRPGDGAVVYRSL
ncbi:MAG: hypothetical protein ACRCU2_09330 [Planktothrix sp.]